MNALIKMIALVLVSTLLSTSPAFAQDKAEDKAEEAPPAKAERAQEVVNDEFGVRIPKPSGWLIGDPPRGALAVFGSAADASSQIEVRVSANVPAEQRQAYFVSFHNSLRRAGFAQQEVRDNVEYG
ncbi:MAG: hypothetical protein ACNA8W_26490, partial [Bradymonadaceae bacterium]